MKCDCDRSSCNCAGKCDGNCDQCQGPSVDQVQDTVDLTPAVQYSRPVERIRAKLKLSKRV